MLETEYKIEMLLKIANTKTHIFDAPEKIVGLLKLNNKFSISQQQNHSDITFAGETFGFTITAESPGIYYAVLSSHVDERFISGYLDSLTEIAREIKITLAENIKSISYEVLWDDVGIYYANMAFPRIMRIENLMRKLISKFMLVSVGIDFFVDIPEDIHVRDNRDHDSGFLHNVDFIDLTKYLFNARPLKKIENLMKTINSLKENKLPDSVNLLEYQNDSYWNRYFKDIVGSNIDASSIKEKWDELYALRCKVAHSRFLKKDECEKIISYCRELERIFSRALESLSNINIPLESKETISEEVFFEIEGETWRDKLYEIILRNFQDEFTLTDMYSFESLLKEYYPENNTIRASIRRNLQILRENGKIEFLKNGRYKIIDSGVEGV